MLCCAKELSMTAAHIIPKSSFKLFLSPVSSVIKLQKHFSKLLENALKTYCLFFYCGDEDFQNCNPTLSTSFSCFSFLLFLRYFRSIT